MANLPEWLRVPRWVSEWIEVLTVAQFLWTIGVPMLGTTILGFITDATSAQWVIMILFGAIVAILLLNFQVKKKTGIAHGKIEESFNDIPDESKITPANQLTGPYINGHQFRISDLAREQVVIRDRTFENCTIWGPAILAVLPGNSFYYCSHTYEQTIDSLLYEINHDRLLIGPIGIANCCFRRCNFKRIGYIGNRGFIENFKRNSITA